MRIAIIAPPADASRIADVLTDGGLETVCQSPDDEHPQPADAVVLHVFSSHPDRVIARATRRDVPVVLVYAAAADAPLPSPGATEWSSHEGLSLRADAYAWRHFGVLEAVRWVLQEDRFTRQSGPLRLTFLGHGGQDYTRSSVAPAIGESFVVDPDNHLLIGRWSRSAAQIRFSTCVARFHAKITVVATGLSVKCMGSTNGTWVGGQRIEDEVVPPGGEIAVAGFLRLRVDGTVGG